MDWYTEDPFSSHRCSKDRVVNKFGLSLLDMCIELNVHIANGRAKGDERGEYTFINQNGHSVIDYFIMSTPMFDWIENFEVLRYDVGCHLPVVCELKWCAYCSCQDNSDSDLQIITLHEYHRCNWNSDNNVIFRNNLNEENVIESLNEISSMCTTQKMVNDIVSKLNSLLSDAARHMIYSCGGNCRKKTFQTATQPGWWEKECKQTRATKNALLNRYRKTDADDDLNSYLQAKNIFRNVVKCKKKLYQEKLRQNLSETFNCQKSFWKCVKSLGDKEQNRSTISPFSWYDHFSNLLNQPSTADGKFQDFVNGKLIDHDMNCNHCNDECADDNILDSPITFHEMQHVVTELPLGKAPGSDGLVY